MSKVWGKMGSGIMFTNNGNVLLQLRSKKVHNAGQWGIPGGALDGTEGMYDPKNLKRPDVDEKLLSLLWLSALKETAEEVGSIPFTTVGEIDDVYKKAEISVDWKHNFPYVTFIVALDNDQLKDWDFKSSLSKEVESHKWHCKDNLPENTMDGVVDTIMNTKKGPSVTEASVSSGAPPGLEEIKVVAADVWTQDQVYNDGVKTYNVGMLHDLVANNTIHRVNVQDLVPQLYDVKVWGEGDRDISPMMVLENPTFDHTYISHMSDIRTARMEKPILIRLSTGRVIDGYHRLTNAFISGMEKIKAVKIEEEQMKGAIFVD